MTTIYRVTAKVIDRPRSLIVRSGWTNLDTAKVAAESYVPAGAKRGWTLQWVTRPGVEDRWYLEQRNSRGRLIFSAIVAKTVA